MGLLLEEQILQRLEKLQQGLRDVKEALDKVQETLAEVRANQGVDPGKVDVVPNPFDLTT